LFALRGSHCKVTPHEIGRSVFFQLPARTAADDDLGTGLRRFLFFVPAMTRHPGLFPKRNLNQKSAFLNCVNHIVKLISPALCIHGKE